MQSQRNRQTQSVSDNSSMRTTKRTKKPQILFMLCGQEFWDQARYELFHDMNHFILATAAAYTKNIQIYKKKLIFFWIP